MRQRGLAFLLPSALLAWVVPALAQPAPAEVEKRVDSILGQMTLEEKIDMLGGVDGFFIRDLPRLKLPRFKMADGPVGVRNFGPATAMAGGISMAATWNPEIAGRIGTELGRDARAKGVHFLLGPGVNIYKAPMNARNFEYLGEDPFLASRIAVAYVKGVQAQGVSATIKHFMGNNSEFDRHNVDAIIDERTAREIYLPVFEAAVKEAHVGAIMDSYNLANGQHLTQSAFFNIDVAKKDWGFDGIMMSDWDATYDAVGAANGGLDLEMPSGKFLNREKLLPAIQSGQVTQATIDDKIRRILRTAVRFGWLDAGHAQADLSIPRYNPQGQKVALDAAREGIVLLKNEGGVLPIDRTKVKTVALIGPAAYPAVPEGGGSGRAEPFAAISLLQGLSGAAGSGVTVLYHAGLPALADVAGTTPFATAEAGGEAGLRAEYFDNPELQGSPASTLVEKPRGFVPRLSLTLPENSRSERWTGYYTPATAGSHEVFVLSGGEGSGSYRLYLDGTLVFDNWGHFKARAAVATLDLDAKPHKVVLEHKGRSFWDVGRLGIGIVRKGSSVDPEAKAMAAKADVAVVAVGFDPDTEGEGSDRTFALPPGQNELIQEIAAVNKHTIVVVTSGGAVDVSPWLDRVNALVEGWYSGQEGGTAAAEVLFGDVNPSGRLPISYDRKWEENPAHDGYYPAPGTNRVEYKEGVFVGYRGYEHSGTKPLFPFGYGLSYTSFKYANLAVKPVAGAAATYEVSFDVSNTGSRAGADVAQVYVADPKNKVPRPPKELKGFAKVTLAPGETKRASVTLDARAFQYYDVKAKGWRSGPGPFDILVGRSSEQIELRGQAPAAAKK